ncbi:MAG: glycosyltransferase [Bacteroidota bacterium]
MDPAALRILCPLRLNVYDQGILHGLRQAGCEVLVLDGRPVTRRQLISAVTGFQPDLLFSYGFWHGRLLPEDISWLCAQYRLPHVYWASDDPTHHVTTSLPLAFTADLVCTTTVELCRAYHALGKKTAYLQFACNPAIHHACAPDGAERHDLVLIANNYSQFDPGGLTYRTRCARMLLEPIIWAGLDLKVYGEGWADSRRFFHLPPPLAGPPVPYERQAMVYAAAKIVLGMQTEGHWPTQTSCRLFEVLGSCAFHLAPATASTTKLFVPGRHLVVTHTAEETLALARYYLAHDEERRRIAAAGQLEAYGKHTYGHRAHEFLSLVSELL